MANYQKNYEKIVLVYDILMQGIDYEAWVNYVEAIVSRFQGCVSAVVDLACGTGSSTFPWAQRGYRVLGVDLSAPMLELADRKAKAAGLAICFLEQNLCALQLPRTVDLTVCFQDGMNYLTSLADLKKALLSVYQNMNSGGFFIFDLNFLPRLTPAHDNLSEIEERDFSLKWKADYLAAENLWEIVVTGQLKHCGERGLFQERHCERIYEISEIQSYLADIGYTVLGCYQSFTFDQPHEQTSRVVCVAQKI